MPVAVELSAEMVRHIADVITGPPNACSHDASVLVKMGKAARLKRERREASERDGFEVKPIDEIRALIAQIRDTDLRTVTVDELVELLNPIYDGWIVRAPMFDPGLSIFRGRKLDTRPKTFAEVGYPPPPVTTQGRANRRGSPLFYGSAAREPIYFELGLSVGDRMAIVQYKTTAKLLANRIGYTHATFEQLQSNREVPDYGNLDVEAYGQTDTLINDFLSEVFCQQHQTDEDWRYNLSAAITEKMIPNDFFGGLIYPTVPMWGNADNFALKPSFVDASMVPVFAEYVVVTEMHEKSYAIESLDEARKFDEDGTIKWLGHPASWTLQQQGEQLLFEAIDGLWIARDPQGNIVEPA